MPSTWLGRVLRALVVVTTVCVAVLARGPLAMAGPSKDDVARARRHAAELHAQARQRQQGVDAAKAKLAALSQQANAALEALHRAKLATEQATAAYDRQRAALGRARQHTAAARDRVQAYAAGAYRAGGLLQRDPTVALMVDGGDLTKALDALTALDVVGAHEGQVVDRLRIAVAQQDQLTRVVAAALAARKRAEAKQAAAKRRADALVAEQGAVLAELDRRLQETQHAASRADRHADALARARRIAIARARAEAARRARAAAQARAAAARAAASASAPAPVAAPAAAPPPPPAAPQCSGGSVSGYPNGRLPTSALCPLWGAPDAMLRADAAAAFNRMSQAYGAVFGTPLCVTASYRPYWKQVQLYRIQPALSAVPGTSNHGWGLAVDLCGGIQYDGSVQHQWLLTHAAAFGWFHPAWARPGGAGPHEPWHWEYVG